MKLFAAGAAASALAGCSNPEKANDDDVHAFEIGSGLVALRHAVVPPERHFPAITDERSTLTMFDDAKTSRAVTLGLQQQSRLIWNADGLFTNDLNREYRFGNSPLIREVPAASEIVNAMHDLGGGRIVTFYGGSQDPSKPAAEHGLQHLSYSDSIRQVTVPGPASFTFTTRGVGDTVVGLSIPLDPESAATSLQLRQFYPHLENDKLASFASGPTDDLSSSATFGDATYAMCNFYDPADKPSDDASAEHIVDLVRFTRRAATTPTDEPWEYTRVPVISAAGDRVKRPAVGILCLTGSMRDGYGYSVSDANQVQRTHLQTGASEDLFPLDMRSFDMSSPPLFTFDERGLFCFYHNRSDARSGFTVDHFDLTTGTRTTVLSVDRVPITSGRDTYLTDFAISPEWSA